MRSADIRRLEARLARLTAAGDGMAEYLPNNGYGWDELEEWEAAKEWDGTPCVDDNSSDERYSYGV